MTNTTEVPAAKKARMETADTIKELKMDAATASAVEEIEADEEAINKLIDEQSDAIIKLEQEYVAKLTPVYQKRSEKIKKIPDFWSTAFMNHPILTQLVDEQDEEVFKALKEIRVDLVNKDVAPGENGTKVKTLNYAVHFVFGDNDYFSDKELVKSFYQMGDMVVSASNPTKIAWKEGKNLIKLTTPKEGDSSAKPSGDDELEDEDEFTKSSATSFFTWFEDHADAENDEIGEHIREDLWAHALTYYLNEDDEESEDEMAEVDLEDEEEEETAE